MTLKSLYKNISNAKNAKIIIFFVAVIFGGWLVLNSEAGMDDNTYGDAWSENIGWINFNGDNYGVNIDENNGKISGYAWSENIGWISFNESDTGAPPSNDPCPDASCVAKLTPFGQLGKTNIPIQGWARALAHDGSWDGWIRFDHGVGEDAYLDTSGYWHGWAWSDGVIGWLSLNSEEGGGPDYRVDSSMLITGKSPGDLPKALSLSVSSHNPSTYCGGASHSFSWEYSDPNNDNEARFQFQVDDNSDFSSPEVDRDYTGLSNPSPTTNNQLVTVSSSPGSNQIGYNTSYYWRVKVYDSEDADSGWITGAPFTTSLHKYPSINFSWSPEYILVDEEILFTDESTVYGGSSKSSWSWLFEGGTPPTSASQNATAVFSEEGEKNITLRVMDSDGYSCSTTVNADVFLEQELPEWKEVSPK